jgi:hypothetical protein
MANWEIHKTYYSGNVKGRDYLGDIVIDGSTMLKIVLEKWCVNM